MASTFDLVLRAIRERKIVIGTYDGYRREMCPHVLGKKNGKEQCLFYQFGGESSSGLEPVGDPANWRCIPLDKLQNVSIEDGVWHSADNYDPLEQKCVGQVSARV